MVHLRGWVVRHVPHGNAVAVRCQPCQRTNTLTRDDLIRVLGGEDAPLEKLDRLRCGDCGAEPDDVWLTWSGVLRSTPPKSC